MSALPPKAALVSATVMSALYQKRTFRQLLVYLPVLPAAAA